MILIFGLCNKIQKRFNSSYFNDAQKMNFEIPYGGIEPRRVATSVLFSVIPYSRWHCKNSLERLIVMQYYFCPVFLWS